MLPPHTLPQAHRRARQENIRMGHGGDGWDIGLVIRKQLAICQ